MSKEEKELNETLLWFLSQPKKCACCSSTHRSVKVRSFLLVEGVVKTNPLCDMCWSEEIQELLEP